MPTKRERDAYRLGFQDGIRHAGGVPPLAIASHQVEQLIQEPSFPRESFSPRKPKRKLSAWNKFVKANSRKKEFRYRDGKLNLKKMGVAFRRKKRR